MSQKSLSVWLRVITVIVALVVLLFFALLVPALGRRVIESFPEFSAWYWPGLILAWCMALPCFAALGLFWCICVNIGRDKSFSEENGRYLSWISRLALFDALFLLAVSILLATQGIVTADYAFIELALIIAGVGIAIIAAALSHMVAKACKLQDDSDLTI